MHKFLTELFAQLFVVFLRLVCGLNRTTVTRQDVFDTYAEQGNNIFVFWHSRLFYLVHYYLRSGVNRRISVLVSMSKDGDYGAALARRLRQDTVRGSTSRGAQKAIRELEHHHFDIQMDQIYNQNDENHHDHHGKPNRIAEDKGGDERNLH